jgi:hypothetical protein
MQKQGNISEIVSDPGARPARVRSRWIVHVVLMLSFVAALVPLLLFNLGSRVTIHVAIACVFAAFVVVHLTQRRRTMRRLAAGLARVGSWLKPSGRLAFSDGILIFLLLNVIASGSLDLATGRNARIPHFVSWHALASVLLFCYLVVHITRRRKRLRKSVIR